jgi:hypothetical protein
MALTDCPECGHKVDENSPQCRYCGRRFVEQSATDCPECGHEVVASAKSCPYCGLDLTERPPNGDRGSQADRRHRQTELELALTKIDLEWERKRPEYMVKRGRFQGGLAVPTKAGALLGSILLGMFGVGIAIACVVTDPEYGLLVGGFWGGLLLLTGLIFGGWYYGDDRGSQDP